MGLSKRRLYKPERAPARKAGILTNNAPNALPNARGNEIAMALVTLGHMVGIEVGRADGYDSLRDEYTVIGKSRETGKAQDFKVKGDEVAQLIGLARVLAGVPTLDPKTLNNKVPNGR